eukprot:scaffold50352_cov40-Cyclotella_meneghiniana.AAC.5
MTGDWSDVAGAITGNWGTAAGLSLPSRTNHSLGNPMPTRSNLSSTDDDGFTIMSRGTFARGINHVAAAFFTPATGLPAAARFGTPPGAGRGTPTQPELPRSASKDSFESMLPPGGMNPPIKSVEDLELEDASVVEPPGAK